MPEAAGFNAPPSSARRRFFRRRGRSNCRLNGKQRQNETFSTPSSFKKYFSRLFNKQKDYARNKITRRFDLRARLFGVQVFIVADGQQSDGSFRADRRDGDGWNLFNESRFAL